MSDSPEKPSRDGITTPELFRRLDGIAEIIRRHEEERRQRDNEVATQRHNLNERVSGIVANLTLEVKSTNANIATLTQTVNRLGDDLKDVKIRVAGNPELKMDGLVQEISGFRTMIETRLTAVETRISVLETDKKSVLRTWGFIAWLVGAVAAIFYFFLQIWDRLAHKSPPTP